MEDTNEGLTSETIAAVASRAVAEALRSGLMDELREIKTTQELMNDRLGRYIQLTEANDRLLRGNGKPGLVTVVEQIAPLVYDHQEALRGKDDMPGMVGRLKAIEGKSESVTKPLWIVLTGLISTGIAVLVEHLVK